MARAATNFSVEDIKEIEALAVDQAKEKAHEIINKATHAERGALKPVKAARLHKNIDAARDTVHVAWIFYNMMLAGEGMASESSRYEASLV